MNMQFVLAIALLCNVAAALEEDSRRLTITERLILAEVARLGGEWETPAVCQFIAFRGKQFRAEHFEMLSHIKTLKWFSARDCGGDAGSLKYLQGCSMLERIDIHGNSAIPDGIKHLAELKRCHDIRLDNLRLSTSALEAIVAHPGLTLLDLDDVVLPESSDEILVALAKRCKVSTIGEINLSDDTKQKLWDLYVAHQKAEVDERAKQRKGNQKE